MPKSMTGYGLATGSVSGGKLQVEIRTVNHRHFTATFKFAAKLQSLEGPARELVREHIHRGHATVNVKWLEDPERATAPKLNLKRAESVVQELRDLKTALQLPGEVDLALVARQPEVFNGSAEDVPEVDVETAMSVARVALEALLESRQREGESLANELTGQLDGLAGRLADVEERAPERIVRERGRLRGAVEELLDGRTVDENRLSTELALLADKLDLTEETVRLRTHIDACREVLEKSSPIGRELAFLGQEMLREANTIGSKANDSVIAQAVIDIKCVLEKIREQVENLE